MSGCQTCGGFGDRHDPIAHGVEDSRGSWAYCGDCGRIVRTTRYGAKEAHTIAPDIDDECPGTGHLASAADVR